MAALLCYDRITNSVVDLEHTGFRFTRGTMIEVIVLCLTAARPALSACSAAGPISLPVTDVLLSNRHVMRGIPFTVGTP